MLRFLGWLFAAGFMVVIGVAAAAVYIIWDVSKDLPDYKQLAAYEPPVMTRMHAADGSLLAEYAEQRRLFVPIENVPKKLMEAYLAAEDKTFYNHSGLDYRGIFAAGIPLCAGQGDGQRGQIVGASTITQQVAKNFLLSSEQTTVAQIEGSADRAAHRGVVQQGPDPRTLSQRNFSRPELLRHCRCGAELFRQVAG